MSLLWNALAYRLENVTLVLVATVKVNDLIFSATLLASLAFTSNVKVRSKLVVPTSQRSLNSLDLVELSSAESVRS